MTLMTTNILVFLSLISNVWKEVHGFVLMGSAPTSSN